MQHSWKTNSEPFYQAFDLPEHIEMLLDNRFLTAFKEELQQNYPDMDLNISEYWDYLVSTALWIDTFEKVARTLAYQELIDFVNGLKYSEYADIFFGCFNEKAEELGVIHSDGDFYLKMMIDWQKVDGLLPVIVQNAQTCEVLMLGYMNQEALDKTLAEKKVTFFSRTKQRLWTKGETSGHFLNVVDMSLDCDNDTLLILANPIGETCHTGAESCFHQFENQSEGDWTWFSKLERTLAERKNADPESSYTAKLYAKGTKKIAQKVGEEGVETALAAMAKDREELVSEVADLVYHLTVLLHNEGLAWQDVIEKLKERHQGIGLHPEGSNK